MAELLMCSQPMRADMLASQCGVNTHDIYGLDNLTSSIHPYRSYLVGQDPSDHDLCILDRFGSPLLTRNLTDIALSVGTDNIHGIAKIHKQLSDSHNSNHAHSSHADHNGGHGSHAAHIAKDYLEKIADVAEKRIDRFEKAVHHYEKSMLQYRQVLKSGGTHAQQVHAKDAAKTAFNKMQRGFRNEMASVNSQVKASRGTPLSNFQRAENIARSSRTAVKLHVTGQAEASNLSKLGTGAKVISKGLVILDFGTRISEITDSYKKGQNWEKKMFEESLSFTTSAAAGTIIADAGIAALSFLAVATPIGWVGLIIGGAIVAGASAAGAIATNNITKEEAGGIYDTIMKWVS